ncbi:hypothetical protein K490DRAFT_43462 [Saccharata proteae CBS 121410]|uniref:Uncharacterized protein n=1 Tax=Saccharata proteae CBS 121410 TaxID=1314787 RepID=A0A9P4HW22_9PEZI|nr:hypothetical protein K490DRAFT_43462 [Saccharata proteae CBS 121410]
MNDYLAILLTILYYVLFLPIYKIAQWIIVVVSPIWFGLHFLLLPFIHLGHFLWQAALLPLNVLAKFETLYVFLGVAGIIGVATGGILYFGIWFLNTALNLQAPEEEPARRTPATYRAERKRKKRAMQGFVKAPAPISMSSSGKETLSSRPRDLLSQTILEEDDSDY